MEERKVLLDLTAEMNVATETKDQDSDDSIEESPPKLRKTRSTRAVSKSAAPQVPLNKPLFPVRQVSVYSSRVSKCLNDFKAGRLQLCIDKDEEDTESSTTGDAESPPKTKKSKEKSVVTLDDEAEEDPDCSLIASTPETSFNRSRSPTPPPALDQMQKPPLKRKVNRHLRKALMTLEGVKDAIGKPDCSFEEDDVIVGDIVSPSPTAQLMTVMVRYKSQVHKFSMKKGETFDCLNRKLAVQMGLEEESLFFMLGERNIKPQDTPRSVDLHIADILDCHVYKMGTAEDLDAYIPQCAAISLYVQCENSRKKVLVKVSKHEPLRKLMSIYAKKVKTELSYLKFIFDGEDISPQSTPSDLDMEENDTIDAVEV